MKKMKNTIWVRIFSKTTIASNNKSKAGIKRSTYLQARLNRGGDAQRE